jgi:hypothetical protein
MIDPSLYEHASRFTGVAEARAEHGTALVDRLLAGCFEADAPADALVLAFRRLPGGAGWQLLEEALAAGAAPAGAPPELEAMLAPHRVLPSWLDPGRLHAGAVAYWRAGAGPLGLSLTCGALAYGYQSASLSRPLAATGRLERMAPRRLGETARWLLSVTTPGAMLPGGRGLAACVRVRLVHALVRAHLLREGGGWDVANWGVPMSASDAGSTAMGGFLCLHLQAMHDLGVHYPRQELEDMTHLWAWIAAVMGVPVALAPPDYAQARLQIRVGMSVDSGPGEDSVRLMHALLHHPAPLIRLLPGLAQGPLTAVHAQLLTGFTRRWMGDEMADRLGVGRTPLTHAALLARPVSRLRGAVLRTGVLGDGERLGSVERAVVRRLLSQGEGVRAPLGPADAAATPVLRQVA